MPEMRLEIEVGKLKFGPFAYGVQNRFFSKSIGGDCKMLETRCNLHPPKNGLVFDAYFERPSFRSLPHVFSQFDGKGCTLAHLAVVHINTSVVVHLDDAFGQ